MKRVFHLTHEIARRNACQAVMTAPENFRVEIRERTRTLDQNSLLWSLLTILSKKLKWPVNGELEFITPEDWKDILSASLHQENRMTQGIRGGFVMLGRSTSKMTVKEMTDLIELIYAFATDKGITLTDQELA
jgi:hypothetical protein